MIENKIVNNLRIVACEEISNSKSGHSGVALSGAPIFYTIYKNLKFDRNDDNYFNRDFFVVSCGHSSSLLYATLNLFNLNYTKEDLCNFRKINSKTPGHPETSSPFVDCSTGPLGQGVANSVGLAIAQKHLKEFFSKDNFEIFNNYTYCFVGDGCMMEGVANESFSLAGKLKLNNLIFIYDRNRKTIEGDISITFNENIEEKFKALNFNIINVLQNDVELINKAIVEAKNNKNKPTIIIVDTTMGYGSNYEDSELCHGRVFTEEEINLLKNKLNINNTKLEFCDDVKNYVNKICKQKEKNITKEKILLEKYFNKNPKEKEKLEKFINFSYFNESANKIDEINTSNNLSTRENNHIVLNKVLNECLNVLGGTGDVASSTLTYLKNEKYFDETYLGRNIHFGVREHAMAGICNGICLSGLLGAFCSCYLSFSDYLKPALRMTALMNLPVLYMFSHDSIFVGQDGPTHQPIEQLVGLRATPNLYTFKPYNLNEILACYKHYLTTKTPTALILSKETSNNEKSRISFANKGGYIIFKEIGEHKATILSSGFEVGIAIEIAKELKGIRVVSIPCFKLFDSQSKKYIEQTLGNKPRIALEFASSYSWHKYVLNGLYLTFDEFGKSGSEEEIKEYFNLTTDKLKFKIKKFLKL